MSQKHLNKENEVAYAFMSASEADALEIKICSIEDRNEDNLLAKETFNKNDVGKQQEFLDKYNASYLK